MSLPGSTRGSPTSGTPRTVSPTQSDALYHLAQEWMDTADSAYIDGSWETQHETDDDEESDTEYHPSSQHTENINLLEDSDEESDQDGNGMNFHFELAQDPDGGISGSESDERGGINDRDTSGTRSIARLYILSVIDDN